MMDYMQQDYNQWGYPIQVTLDAEIVLDPARLHYQDMYASLIQITRHDKPRYEFNLHTGELEFLDIREHDNALYEKKKALEQTTLERDNIAKEIDTLVNKQDFWCVNRHKTISHPHYKSILDAHISVLNAQITALKMGDQQKKKWKATLEAKKQRYDDLVCNLAQHPYRLLFYPSVKLAVNGDPLPLTKQPACVANSSES